METNNQKIVRILKYLFILRQIQGEQRRAKAYENAIATLDRHPEVITSGAQIKELHGIGKSISLTVDRILNNHNPNVTGVPDLDNLPPETMHRIRTIIELSKEKGIGYKTATKYYDQGIHTREQLMQQKPQHRAVEFGSELDKKIHRDMIYSWSGTIGDIIDDMNRLNGTELQFHIAGSFSRGKELCGDADVMLFSKVEGEPQQYVKELVDRLTQQGSILKTLMFGDVKYRGVAFNNNYAMDDFNHPFQVDIEIVASMETFPYELIYFTGPDFFVRHCRSKANNLGYDLTNHQMIDRRTNRKVIVDDEHEIFELLREDYMTPEQRNNFV